MYTSWKTDTGNKIKLGSNVRFDKINVSSFIYYDLLALQFGSPTNFYSLKADNCKCKIIAYCVNYH